MTGFLKQTVKQLCEATPISYEGDMPEVKVSGIAYDLRIVKPGDIFIALTGGNQDAHQYIPMAASRGAVCAIGSKPISEIEIPYLQVTDTRLALGYLSAAFYGFPSRSLTVIGVTGTDGKTTTSNIIYQILLNAGIRVGIISTVNAVIGDEILDTGFHVTTPEAPDIQRYLARMVTAGLTHVILETTSHGLAQERVTGVEYDLGVVTNITHEHLDFHGSYENYRAAKGKLFTNLVQPKNKIHAIEPAAILNMDDASYPYLKSISALKQISYGFDLNAEFRVQHWQMTPAGMQFKIEHNGKSIEITCPYIGKFNISNCLAAISATVGGLGIDWGTVTATLLKLPPVPGRMEVINLGQDFTAIVDFAHTPNALRVALQTARELTKNRVIAVFGSAGLRDREKRQMMAEVSAELADLSILTAEDPRTESLDQILDEMAVGAEAKGAVPGKTYWKVPDRGDAIREGIKIAEPGDLVIACGKGHEQSMCFGEIEYPWDDRTAMRAALAELLGISTAESMPQLPTSRKAEA